jgi:CheY-like chemotaxis protein
MPVRKSPRKNLRARILIVDDNVHGLTARKTILEERGHQVTAVSNPSEALNLFAAGAFDLVLTDYRMPRMNGAELIAALRGVVPTIPVILLSGYVDSMGLSEESTGADAVLQKSGNELNHLTRTVDRLLERQARRKAVRKKPPEGEEPKSRRKSA